MPKNVRVLDVGCGDGSLRESFNQKKKYRARGLELKKENVTKCIFKGLPIEMQKQNSSISKSII